METRRVACSCIRDVWGTGTQILCLGVQPARRERAHQVRLPRTYTPRELFFCVLSLLGVLLLP